MKAEAKRTKVLGEFRQKSMIGKIISWNIKGINDLGKKNTIRGCLNRWNQTIVCLQETKMKSITDATIKSIWRVDEVDWHFLIAKNTAGGILLMQKKDWVMCQDVKIGETSIFVSF